MIKIMAWNRMKFLFVLSYFAIIIPISTRNALKYKKINNFIEFHQQMKYKEP
jgi:hypothetical protein